MGDATGKGLTQAALAGAIVALALVASPMAHAGVYKWVDEKGVTHYSDKMPPEYVNRGAVEMSKTGMTIRKTDPAPTAEQLKARAEEEAKKREAAKAEVEQKRRDVALLNSYTNEHEIGHVKQRNISVLEGVIATTQRRIGEMHSRRQELETERGSLEQQGKQIASAKQRELTSIEDQLPTMEEMVAQKSREIETLRSKYDGDLKRYRELTSQSASNTR